MAGSSTEVNSVNYLLQNKFSSLDFALKLEIKSKGRQTPRLTLSNIIPSSSKRKGYTRHFQVDTYERFSWLTGCPIRNRLFCFPCLLFDSECGSQWTSTGFHSLSNLSKAAKKHASGGKCHGHKAAEISLAKFGEGRVEECLSTAFAEQLRTHNAEVDRNRLVLSRFVDCVKFLSIHELAFRGNDESYDSTNRGNYKDLASLIAKYDPILDNHLSNSTVFRGDSALVQNEMIHSLASCVLEKIKEELNSALFVSIQADETTDVSSSAQYSISVRYVRDWFVVERFIGFYNVSGESNAHALSQLIIGKVKELGLQSKLIGQAYDGAATMAGCKSGVQKQVGDEFPMAVFIHCHAHRLNLVLQKSAASVKESAIFFSTLSGLHSFFTRSPKRMSALKALEKSLHVTAPSSTRWNFKSRAIVTLHKNYSIFIQFFEKAVDGEEGFSDLPYCECRGFLDTLQERRFRFLLVCFNRVFGPANILFEQLQSVEASIVDASRRISSLDQKLEELKSESAFNQMLESADSMIVDGEEPSRKRPRFCNNDSLQALHQKILSHVQGHFRARFRCLGELFFIGLGDIHRFDAYANDFPEAAFSSLVTSRYCSLFDIDELHTELELLYPDSSVRGSELAEVLEKIQRLSLLEPFKEAVRLFTLILTLPLTTASSERSFSALGRIKSHSRNKMLDTRLSSLAMISIESALANSISNDDVISKFAQKDRRINLRHK